MYLYLRFASVIADYEKKLELLLDYLDDPLMLDTAYRGKPGMKMLTANINIA